MRIGKIALYISAILAIIVMAVVTFFLDREVVPSGGDGHVYFIGGVDGGVLVSCVNIDAGELKCVFYDKINSEPHYEKYFRVCLNILDKEEVGMPNILPENVNFKTFKGIPAFPSRVGVVLRKTGEYLEIEKAMTEEYEEFGVDSNCNPLKADRLSKNS